MHMHQDFSSTFVPGSISIILTVRDPDNPTQKLADSSELLNIIYKSYTTDNLDEIAKIYNDTNNRSDNDNKKKNNKNYIFKAGDILIHGRSQREWNLVSMRDRILFMKETDLELNLPAGTIFSSVLRFTIYSIFAFFKMFNTPTFYIFIYVHTVLRTSNFMSTITYVSYNL